VTLPLPPAVPGLPVLGNLLEFYRDPVSLIRHGSETLGPIFSVRLGPKRAAVLLGPENHRFFFEETGHRLSMSEVYRWLIPMVGDFLAFEGENRSLIVPAFQGKNMATNVQSMVREAAGWLDGLAEEGELELVESFGPLLMLIAARAFMGDDFRERIGRDLWQLFRDLAGGIDYVLPLHLPIPRFRRRDRARRCLEGLVHEVIAERRRRPEGHHDLLQWLLQTTYSNGEPLADATVCAAMLAVIFGGHETTQGHLAWGLVQLLENPGFLATVLAEQDEVLAGGAGLDLATLSRLRRLRWSLKETERMFPVVPFIARHVAAPYERGGFHVPRGWLTLICPPVAHRLPEVFPDPDRYDPERFSPGRQEARTDGVSLIGFGGGRHLCLGMELAYLEMKVILTLLLERFTLELVGTPRPVTGLVTGRPAPPCLVRYRRR
jgi:sterol 14-demethylase